MRWLATLLLFLLGCTTAGQVQRPLTVMVYNIHAGKDARGGSNLEQVAALIAQSEADVVLLQEIDRRTTRSGGVDHFEELRRLTGFHGAFGKSLDFQGGEYGIATFSRYPITTQSIVQLDVEPAQTRSGGSKEPRIALIVTTATPDGGLAVVNTHMDASREDSFRLQEIRRVALALSGISGTSILFGGDLNATPESEVHAVVRGAGFVDSWVGCGAGEGLTFPSTGAIKRIDYLYLDSNWKCVAARVLASDASDHQAVVFRLIAK